MRALFHCFGGINRSAGILCAGLAVAYEHSAQEAVQLLLQKRPAWRPWRNRPYVLEALWHVEGLRAECQRDFSAALFLITSAHGLPQDQASSEQAQYVTHTYTVSLKIYIYI